MYYLLIISSIIASFFWAAQLIFSFLYIYKKRNINNFACPPFTVIIPSFNESNEAVNKTVSSILNQKNINDFEIIVIDDGSKNPLSINILDNVTLIRTELNQGKRDAQAIGILKAKYDWIVTIDSDTELDEYCIYNLLKNCEEEQVDASTGNVLLLNENKNILTKMTACMYWFSFFQERASQAYFKNVICCSGAISCYRKQIILDHLEEYINQTFLNNKCQIGDDRHLTNIFILNNKKVSWSKDSIAYTESPSEYYKFTKQQIRWAKGNIISFSYILPRIKKWNIYYTFFTCALVYRYLYILKLYIIMLIYLFIYHDIYMSITIITTALFVTFLKLILAYLYTYKKNFIYMFYFTVYNFFILNPIILYSLFTVGNMSWGTRSNAKK